MDQVDWIESICGCKAFLFRAASFHLCDLRRSPTTLQLERGREAVQGDRLLLTLLGNMAWVLSQRSHMRGTLLSLPAVPLSLFPPLSTIVEGRFGLMLTILDRWREKTLASGLEDAPMRAEVHSAEK